MLIDYLKSENSITKNNKIKMTDNNNAQSEIVNKEEEDDHVDPWTVASNSETGVNYDKLIGKVYFYLIKADLFTVMMKLLHLKLGLVHLK